MPDQEKRERITKPKLEKIAVGETQKTTATIFPKYGIGGFQKTPNSHQKYKKFPFV